jgi:arylsulfatase A-like enzyme
VVKGTVKFDDGDKQTIRDLYDAEVLYQDSLLAPIFDFLADSGLLENTLVILTADHAEELLDHGFIGHASTSEAATVYDEVVRIPLLIKIPGNPVAEPVGNLVRQIDIMPTLFDVMGLKPRYLGQGRSLLPLIKKERQQNTLAFIETSYCGWQCPKDRLKERISAVRSDTWKFVEERKPTGTSHSFYDLVADKGETVNLYGAKETGEYQAILSAWQKENLQIARDRAMDAAGKHLLAAQQYGEQGNYRSAIQEIEQLLHLNEIYSIENPSFIEDPILGETWKTTLQDAEKLLLRYREKERAP